MSASCKTATLGVPDMPNMVQLLWKRAEGGLREEEIKWLAESLEETARTSHYLAGVVESIGFLVESDGGKEISAGSFQSPKDVAGLLYSISRSIDNLGAAVWIGDRALDKLEQYRRLHANYASTRSHQPDDPV